MIVSYSLRRPDGNQVILGYLHPLSAFPLFRARNMYDKPCRIAQVYENGWCPSIACRKEQRSDVERSLAELGVQVAKQARAQQGFHGHRRVRHTCRQSWAIQPLTGLGLRESHDLRSGRTSRAAIAVLRHTDRRPPSPDDWHRWRTPEVDRVPSLGRVQQACALCVLHTRYRGTPPAAPALPRWSPIYPFSATGSTAHRRFAMAEISPVRGTMPSRCAYHKPSLPTRVGAHAHRVGLSGVSAGASMPIGAIPRQSVWG